jgi:hypothetical protein
MANYNDEGYITRLASADLSAKQFFIVKQATDRTVSLSSAATDFHIGVIQLGAASGGEVSIAARNKDGTFKVAAGAAITAGTFLTADSTGRAVSTTTPNDEVIGVAQEAASAAGQIIEYLPLSRKY